MALHLKYVAHSEIGLVRKNNQDSGYASPTMLVVADGMGGAAAGDLASAVAVTELHAADKAWNGTDDMLTVMENVIAKANEHIADLVVDNHDLDGMGTTVCGGLFDGERLGIGHIGDSRGYLVRDGEMSRLTQDHSWVQNLVNEGKITEEEALYHPHRSLLLKVLNGHPTNTPDLFNVTLQAGDRVMFCSDGLCGLAEDGDLQADLEIADLDECLAALVATAHAGGGLDNITIVLADVVADPPEPAMVPLVLGAATEVTIPAIQRPTFALVDDDLDEVVRRDAHGNVIPDAPAPSSQPTPDQIDEIITPGPVEDPEDARYRPRKSRRSRWLWALSPLLALTLVAGIGFLIGQNYLSSRYYIGVADTKVAIYQGVPDKLGPWELGKLAEVSDVDITDLPQNRALEVRNNEYSDGTLEGMRVTVASLRGISQNCIEKRRQRAAATASPTPTATPSATPTPDATPGASPSPTDSASPMVASASPTTASPTPSYTQAPPPEEC